MSISVIIPCYNQGRYLADSVGSLLAQTEERWEAVIVEVTKQEMLHLALATDLLTAIEAAHTHRPNFPHYMARDIQAA